MSTARKTRSKKAASPKTRRRRPKAKTTRKAKARTATKRRRPRKTTAHKAKRHAPRKKAAHKRGSHQRPLKVLEHFYKKTQRRQAGLKRLIETRGGKV